MRLSWAPRAIAQLEHAFAHIAEKSIRCMNRRYGAPS